MAGVQSEAAVNIRIKHPVKSSEILLKTSNTSTCFCQPCSIGRTVLLSLSQTVKSPPISGLAVGIVETAPWSS